MLFRPLRLRMHRVTLFLTLTPLIREGRALPSSLPCVVRDGEVLTQALNVAISCSLYVSCRWGGLWKKRLYGMFMYCSLTMRPGDRA